MGAEDFSGMFNWAKILLGARYNFANIGNHAAAVGAVSTVKFLNKIKVLQMLPIKNNVIGTAYFFNAVNGEASDLIKRNEYIGDQQGDNQ